MDTSTIWNEIDIGYGNGPSYGSESQFLPATFSPNENKNVFNSTTTPKFTDTFANEYHNYTLFWMPGYVAWAIDGTVFWNATNT